jgi:hypothetical protein
LLYCQVFQKKVPRENRASILFFHLKITISRHSEFNGARNDILKVKVNLRGVSSPEIGSNLKGQPTRFCYIPLLTYNDLRTPVPIDMPKSDFGFRQIVVELFVFEISKKLTPRYHRQQEVQN